MEPNNYQTCFAGLKETTAQIQASNFVLTELQDCDDDRLFKQVGDLLMPKPLAEAKEEIRHRLEVLKKTKTDLEKQLDGLRKQLQNSVELKMTK